MQLRRKGLALLGRLERHLEHSVAETIAVERLNGHHRLFVVDHRHKAVASALVRARLANNLEEESLFCL